VNKGEGEGIVVVVVVVVIVKIISDSAGQANLWWLSRVKHEIWFSSAESVVGHWLLSSARKQIKNKIEL
jgi:hypothetical protein